MDPNKLLPIHSLLHLVFHRNKNQHGKSKWWKWLAILKRTILNLAEAVNSESDPSPYIRRTFSVERYKGYLATLVIPRCYLAFSTVVADGQFSTLGVVLLSILADLASAARIKHGAMTLPLSGKKVVDKGLLDVGGAAEDVGEVVPRARDILGPGGRLDSNTSSKLIPGSIGASKEPKRKARDERTAPKKKNRKENTIDDLFKGVL